MTLRSPLSAARFCTCTASLLALLSLPIPPAHAAPDAADGAAAAAVQTLPAIPGVSAAALEKLRAKAVSGRFEETKVVPGFPKPMTSSGVFSLKDGALRWETKEPFPSVMTISPEGIRFEADGLAPAGAAGGSSPAAAKVSALLSGVLSGDFSALAALFELSGREGPEGVEVSAVPKDPALSAMIAKIELWGRETVERVVVTGAAAGGDRTEMRFFDVKAER